MQLTYALAVVALTCGGLGVFVGVLYEKAARSWRDYQFAKAQVPLLRAAWRLVTGKAAGGVLLAALVAIWSLSTLASK